MTIIITITVILLFGAIYAIYFLSNELTFLNERVMENAQAIDRLDDFMLEINAQKKDK